MVISYIWSNGWMYKLWALTPSPFTFRLLLCHPAYVRTNIFLLKAKTCISKAHMEGLYVCNPSPSSSISYCCCSVTPHESIIYSLTRISFILFSFMISFHLNFFSFLFNLFSSCRMSLLSFLPACILCMTWLWKDKFSLESNIMVREQESHASTHHKLWNENYFGASLLITCLFYRLIIHQPSFLFSSYSLSFLFSCKVTSSPFILAYRSSNL